MSDQSTPIVESATVTPEAASRLNSNLNPTEPISEPAPKAPAPPSDYELLYKEAKEENKRLAAILDAARISVTPNPNQAAKPVVTAARVKAVVGQVGLLKMTRDEKLKALGVDPASITDEGLRKLFGRGADPSLGADLMKTNPGRYRILREAAILTNAYGG